MQNFNVKQPNSIACSNDKKANEDDSSQPSDSVDTGDSYDSITMTVKQ